MRGPRRNRSIQVGIIGTIILHLLLFWGAPLLEEHFMGEAEFTNPAEDPARKQFDIQIMPDLPEPPNRFVEANPDAPDNPPDKTDNFADRNQQLAQEKPATELGDMPSTEGRDDIDSTAIVTGDGAEPKPPAAYVPPSPENAETEIVEQQETPALAQSPLGGTEDMRGDNKESYGTNVVKLPDHPDPDVNEKVEGVKDDQATKDGKGLYFRPNPNRPAARPSLAQSQIQPAVFSNHVAGTENIGVVAHNALKTTFGVYFERMKGVIYQGWIYDIKGKIERRLGFPLEGSRVEVSFTLLKSGKITIDRVNGNSGPLWDGVAVDAIASPARTNDGFGEWPDDMIAVLGDSTPIRMTFFYQ